MESPFSWDAATRTIDEVLDWHFEWTADGSVKARELAERLFVDFNVDVEQAVPVIVRGLEEAQEARDKMLCGWSTPMRIRQALASEGLLPPL